MQNLVNKAYEMIPDNLIMDASKTLDATIVSMTSPQAVIERGTILGVTAEHEPVVYGTADSNATPCYVVSDTVDATEETGTVEVGVYIAGSFRKSATKVADGYTLSESDLLELRKLGIILK